MQQTITCLIQLQQVDSQIHELVKIRDTYPARVREVEKKIDKQQVTLQFHKTELEEVEQERHVKEELLKGEEEKLKKWEKRLMESKNHREVAPLAREIDAQKRMNQEAQEELQRLKEDEERLRKELASIQGVLDEMEAERKKEAKVANAKVQEFAGSLEALEKEREQFTTQLRSSLFRKYESIRKRREGLAVVPAREGSCTGCNMRLRRQLYNEIQKMQSMKTCPNCQRILYWEKGLENGTS